LLVGSCGAIGTLSTAPRPRHDLLMDSAAVVLGPGRAFRQAKTQLVGPNEQGMLRVSKPAGIAGLVGGPLHDDVLIFIGEGSAAYVQARRSCWQAACSRSLGLASRFVAGAASGAGGLSSRPTGEAVGNKSWLTASWSPRSRHMRCYRSSVTRDRARRITSSITGDELGIQREHGLICRAESRGLDRAGAAEPSPAIPNGSVPGSRGSSGAAPPWPRLRKPRIRCTPRSWCLRSRALMPRTTPVGCRSAIKDRSHRTVTGKSSGRRSRRRRRPRWKPGPPRSDRIKRGADVDPAVLVEVRRQQ
jgi:hypothetical protein